ncbi:MAG: Gfo/Idh/MocA family oxidoreductase [Caldisericia bacterium]|nr:Gfo/Idh/MocA family oxidoreductase [Caldisericia bacterium]
MKILFVGLGSIGQRHLQNLKKILSKMEIKSKVQIFALIKNIDIHRVIKEGKCFKVKDVAKYYNIKIIKSLQKAKGIRPDVVFVANPSALHIKTALEFAKGGSDVFIEKPLGNNLNGLNELERIIKSKKLISMVGYQTRFNPLIKEVKHIIKNNLKKVITASFEWNTFLPVHHRYEKYSKGYAARKDLGGGVVFDLIHEIDLIYYLFGLPKQVLAIGDKLSDLEIDVEDTIMSFLEYRANGKLIPIYLNLSYAQTKEVRKFKIQFTDATLFVDLMENSYELYSEEGVLVKEKKDETKRNDLFVREITYFLNCIKKRKDTCIDVSEGKKSLEVALKIKKSMKIKNWVK